MAAQSVELDEAWGKACLGYQAQIDLRARPEAPDSAALVQGLAEVQARLGALDLPVALRPTPLATVHVSVYAFVPVSWQHADKDAVWTELGPRAELALSRACSAAQSFVLSFRRVRVFPRAIVAVAEPAPAVLVALRDQLRDVLAGSPVPPPHYDLVHTTLARFAAPGQLSASHVAAIESLPLSLSHRVQDLRLLRERVYPSLVVEEIARVRLR